MCVLSTIRDGKGEERVGESVFGSAAHGIGDSFLFFFFLLLLVCDSLFNVTRKAVGNMGYFPVAGDVCVADVSPGQGPSWAYIILRTVQPRGT